MSPYELAQSVYAVLRPVDARGTLVSPKIRAGALSVRNLENTTRPVAGASAARTSLEAVLFIFAKRDVVLPHLEAFLGGNGKLYGLRSLAKLAG